MFDVEERFMNGKLVEEKEYELKMLPNKLKELKQKYGLKYNPEEIIPSKIDSEIKDIFNAAVDLIEELGFYNPDTRRVATFTRREIEDHVRSVPHRIVYGEGQDAVVAYNRKPEDKIKPLIECGTYGTPISDEIYIPLNAGFAQEGNRLWSAGIRRFDNKFDVVSGAPSEVLAGMTEGYRMREALRRAGKPGMQLVGVGSASSDKIFFAAFNAPGGYRRTVDCALISFPAEMKMPWDRLNRSAWCQQEGIMQNPNSQTILGGYAGGPETAVICHVAEEIGTSLVTNAPHTGAGSICDFNGYFGNKQTVWANSRAILAIKTYYSSIVWGGFGPAAGPCTDVVLLEMAALVPMYQACGMDWICGNVSTIGVLEDHQTPLEVRFQNEIHEACLGIKLADAEEFYNRIQPLYKDRLDVTHHSPGGKRFQDCYDPIKLTPSKEWLDIYNEVKKKLAEFGYEWK